MTRRVLLVDDDAAVREALGMALDVAGFETLTAGSFVEAKDHVGRAFDGVIVSDIRMPGRDGFHLLDYARAQDADLPVILLTGEGDIPMAVRAMTEGAFGFLEKPCATSDLASVITRALKTRTLVLEHRKLKAQLETGDPAARLIFGVSSKSDQLRAQVRTAARAGTEVLITGAPGSGISKVAEVLHLCSLDAKGPLEKRSAAGLQRDTLWALWRDCAGGSLFLDDITALSVDCQLALLDALEEGGTRLIAGHVAGSDAARLSTDLHYRLEVMQVQIPALSERPEDIPVMFRQYVAQAAEQSGLPEPEISDEVIADVLARQWPGNARALMSHAMRFVLGQDRASESPGDLGLTERVARYEQTLLTQALRDASGQASLAAKALKLPRKTFYDKLAKYAIKPENFRDG